LLLWNARAKPKLIQKIEAPKDVKKLPEGRGIKSEVNMKINAPR